MSIEQKKIPARVFLSAKKTLTIPKIPVFAEEVVERIFKEADELKLVTNGPCEFIYFGCTGNAEEPFDLRIAIPVEKKKTNPELFEYYESPAFVCVYQDYQGSMKNIGDGWDSFCAEAENDGFRFSDGGHVREVYKKWIGFDDSQNITELQIEI